MEDIFARDTAALTTLAEVESAHNTMRAMQDGDRVNLDVDGAVYATYHPTRLLTGYSWDAITAGALLAGPPARVLILGYATGTVARQLRALVPDAAITGVELDPAVLALGRAHFSMDDIAATVICGDADVELAALEGTFDVIIDDLYLTGADDVVRATDLGEARLTTLKAHLAPGGLIVANCITDYGHDAVARAAGAAFERAFDACCAIRPARGLNAVYVGGADARAAGALLPYAAQLESPDAAFWRAMRIVPTAAIDPFGSDAL